MKRKEYLSKCLSDLQKIYYIPNVCIRFGKLKSNCGEAIWHDNGIKEIIINNNIKSRPELLETAVHEYAHFVSNTVKHNSSWGKAYAKLWKGLMD